MLKYRPGKDTEALQIKLAAEQTRLGLKSMNKTIETCLEKYFQQQDENNGHVVDINMPFTSIKFGIEWEKWKNYRQQEHGKKYKTPISEQQALDNLKEISMNTEDIAIKLIKNAIDRGWKGIFPINNAIPERTWNKPQNQPRTGPVSMVDAFKKLK